MRASVGGIHACTLVRARDGGPYHCCCYCRLTRKIEMAEGWSEALRGVLTRQPRVLLLGFY